MDIVSSFEGKDVDEWGKFIIYDLYKFIKTNYILLIHPDGFVVNPELWDKKFKDFDYIGAPWPPPLRDALRSPVSVCKPSFSVCRSDPLSMWMAN